MTDIQEETALDDIELTQKRELHPCPVATTISLIGNKWKLFILRDLMQGTRRFGELRKSIDGISQKVLTQNLRALESDGIVIRQVYAEVPPRVEYRLSDLGQTLQGVIDVMGNWGESYKKAVNNTAD